MNLSEAQHTFLENNHNAAMITTAKNGTPKVARVGVELLDGRLLSSGTEDRIRTARLRRDPRCTLFVFEAGWKWLTLETSVSILDGPETPALQVRLFRKMQNRPSGNLSWFGKELSEAELLSVLGQERRLIYEFEILQVYGMV